MHQQASVLQGCVYGQRFLKLEKSLYKHALLMMRLHVRLFPILLTTLQARTRNDHQTFLKQAGTLCSHIREKQSTRSYRSRWCECQTLSRPFPQRVMTRILISPLPGHRFWEVASKPEGQPVPALVNRSQSLQKTMASRRKQFVPVDKDRPTSSPDSPGDDRYWQKKKQTLLK